MKNPWSQLPSTAPRVLESDRGSIDGFNLRYADNPQFVIQTQIFPEPFIGNPDCRVYILNLNPGYSKNDDHEHKKQRFVNAIKDNLNHQSTAYPFYFLHPEFANAPGSKWWVGRSRWLINEIGQQSLANRWFCVELFPYHSQKYKRIPKSISPNGLVPSSNYSVHLVRQAMLANKAIVVMRAFGSWCNQIPELNSYRNLYRINNPRNPTFSPNNINGYKALLREFKSAD